MGQALMNQIKRTYDGIEGSDTAFDRHKTVQLFSPSRWLLYRSGSFPNKGGALSWKKKLLKKENIHAEAIRRNWVFVPDLLGCPDPSISHSADDPSVICLLVSLISALLVRVLMECIRVRSSIIKTMLVMFLVMSWTNKSQSY